MITGFRNIPFDTSAAEAGYSAPVETGGWRKRKMHCYIQKLYDAYEEKNSLLCFGMDPVIERMTIDSSRNLADEIVRYFSGILEAIKQKVAAVKPNLGFYLQYGHDGLKALVELVSRAKALKLPVIIDAKIGDIGKTSQAYARFIFDVLGGDAVTLSPYLGSEALRPFLTSGEAGCYVLGLTSNPGARDFQLEKIKPETCLYEYVLKMICCWNREYPAAGAVVGATQENFRNAIALIGEYGSYIPLLIPGVGAQGGDYRTVVGILKENGYTPALVRINASSSLSYAHERYPSLSVEEASFSAVKALTDGA
jgi:orotidine 5'-phosphate decarboxylase subfamily 2